MLRYIETRPCLCSILGLVFTLYGLAVFASHVFHKSNHD